MVIKFECPSCHAILRIPRRYIGMAGTCKYCHRHITISPQETTELFVTRDKGETFGNYLKRWFNTHWTNDEQAPTKTIPVTKPNAVEQQKQALAQIENLLDGPRHIDNQERIISLLEDIKKKIDSQSQAGGVPRHP